MLLPLLIPFVVYLTQSAAKVPRITLGDIPFYKFPCTGNITELTERQQQRCKSRFANYGFGSAGLGYNRISKNNNVYCKVFRLCLNFSFGNLYLSAYGYWRGKGFYTAKNYNIHALGGDTVEGAVEVQRPRVDALKNAISVIRRKNSGDNLALGLKKEEDAEKIVKEGHAGENVGEKDDERRRRR